MEKVVGTDLIMPDGAAKAAAGDDAFIAELDRLRVGMFCRMSGWRMPDDIVELFNDGDVIEIYGLDLVQLYCNGKFFQVTSISAEDQATKRFDDLYLRPAHINQAIGKDVQRMLEANGRVIEMHVPEHTLKESCGEKRTIKVNFKYGAAMKNRDGEVTGIIVTQTADWVASPMLTLTPNIDQAAPDIPEV